jgi:hypothetical protein
MNLLDLINTVIGKLDALIRATPEQADRAKLITLRNALDAMSDQAVHQLFDTSSADFANAVAALNKASADADEGIADVSRVGQAINATVEAAKATDKLVGFLAHLA